MERPEGPKEYGHIRTWAEFILKNFATPIAFYFTFRLWGAKPAIGFAVLTTGIQVVIHRYYSIRMTPFFLVASGFTVFFGCIDLLLATPRFFRLEPAVQNFILGVVFLATVFTRRPIALWFAQALPAGIRPVLDDSEKNYLLVVTKVWTVYFWLKGAFFLWLAFQVDLGQLVILRSIIGGGSLALMFGGEIAYRLWFRDRRRRARS